MLTIRPHGALAILGQPSADERSCSGSPAKSFARRRPLAEQTSTSSMATFTFVNTPPNTASVAKRSSCGSGVAQPALSWPAVRRALLALFLLAASTASAADTVALRSALTFHASFDGGTDADFALGDRKFYNAPAMNQRAAATAGLPTNSFVVAARGEGRWGDALRFKEKSNPIVFFNAAKNVAYRDTNWSGTVSFWLSTDPPGELKPGFCDPIQITP